MDNNDNVCPTVSCLDYCIKIKTLTRLNKYELLLKCICWLDHHFVFCFDRLLSVETSVARVLSPTPSEGALVSSTNTSTPISATPLVLLEDRTGL